MTGSESDFHSRAEAMIEAIHDALDRQDDAGLLDLESADGLLTISPEKGGRPWIVSRHSAAREIWLSSPTSGGLHFRDDHGSWTLPDGRELLSLLSQELSDAFQRPYTVTAESR